jgi:hypothetical protein
MNGVKIMSMKVEHITFLDSLNKIPFPPRKFPDAFGLTSCKRWYPHYYNTTENLNDVGAITDLSFYGVDAMLHSEREEFLAWYEGQGGTIFDNRQVFESYCQDNVTVLRQACQTFQRHFLDLCNIEVFLEAITITSGNFGLTIARGKWDLTRSFHCGGALEHREATDDP